MGLCKCPKRKVTTQFCFEHRVNVCEHCMVSNHPKCIVQSYIQWLQDSDYNTVCELCKMDLQLEDCVRLTCYHVLHWPCLDEYGRRNSGDLSTLLCPSCDKKVFFQPNLVSPVAEALKSVLMEVNWGREGLGLPLLSVDKAVAQRANAVRPDPVGSTDNQMQESSFGYHEDIQKHSDDMAGASVSRESVSLYNSAGTSDSYGIMSRKIYDQPIEHRPLLAHDRDEDKYKRRTCIQNTQRWIQNQLVPPSRHWQLDDALYKRYAIMATVAILVFIFIMLILYSMGRGYDIDDPMFDPHFNPNVRVEE
ncbi:unnamed protein product [Cyprideis torosa]|uniref:Zinc finger protein-like 1 homolog n=1 Tax=Cyprideis torosa TaxID=163714 RepID=A0A7R8W8P9_9CRUS|nr:unnamed protein product [Cyprideis torosa]CAG0887704.1 unnamed protein product [Cyprideis torosa]